MANVSFRLKALELPIETKAAALLHSHVLIDGNKRFDQVEEIAAIPAGATAPRH